MSIKIVYNGEPYGLKTETYGSAEEFVAWFNQQPDGLVKLERSTGKFVWIYKGSAALTVTDSSGQRRKVPVRIF